MTYCPPKQEIDMPKRLFISIALVGSISFTGCSQSNKTSHQFHVDLVDGVEEAISSGGPKYDDELFEYILVTRLEETEGIEESILVRAGDYKSADNGKFYVADSGDYRIAEFDADGEYLRSIGQQGDGPGEFRSVGELHIDGEYIQAWDYLAHRLNIFRLDGSFVRMVRPPQRPSYTFRLLVARNGNIFASSGDTRHDQGLQINSAHFTVYNDAGDSLTTIKTDYVAGAYQWENGDQSGVAPLPYSSSATICLLPNSGWALSTGMEPAIEIQTELGTPVRTIRIELPEESIDRTAIRQAWRQSINTLETSNPRAAAFQRGFLETLQFPEYKAFWAAMFIDDAGYFWLRLPRSYSPGLEEDERIGYRILSPEGEYLGISFPPDPRGYGSVSHGMFLGWEENPETGLRTPTVYRLRPRPRGFRYP